MAIRNPAPLPDKCVVAVVPHTSNWDFPIGLAVRRVMDEPIGFVAKSSLFRWPFGGLFRWLGGVPVDRSKRTNFVQAVADIFTEREIFKLAVAPEGTRRRVEKLKTGFYYIAKTAGVHIVPCVFDWSRGEVRFGKPFIPTDDESADFARLYDFYRGALGYNPEFSFEAPATDSSAA
jgi:1-acyl-sn-glycerol-3-phosphate acyltransferase